MLAARRRCRQYSEPQSAMTSMIDVVFLLMVFFIITLDPDDLLASMPVSRPAPEKEVTTEVPPSTLRFTVMKDRYLINGKTVDLDYVDWYLRTRHRRLGADDAIIVCEGEADHGRLIRALDVFMKNDVTNLSMMSR